MDGAVIAALVAAVVSLISAWLSQRAARHAENIGARRTLLQSDFKELSRLLWSVVAYSQMALATKSQEIFDENIKRANTSAEKLNILRIEQRIILGPLCDAIYHLTLTPKRIPHTKKDQSERRGKRIVSEATSLRAQIDEGLGIIYVRGGNLGLLFQWKLRCKCMKIRRIFESHTRASLSDRVRTAIGLGGGGVHL
jgi:hypothetical protein